MLKAKSIYLTFLLFIIFVRPTFSQSANDALRLAEPGIFTNARALGLGNSYTGISNDYMATYFNPAGLGRIKSSWVSGGIYFANNQNSTSFFSNSLDYGNNSTNFSNLGAVIKAPTSRGSLVFAVGYNKSRDFNGGFEFNGFNPNNNSMIQDLTSFNDNITYDVGLSYEVRDDDDNYLYDETNINGMLNQSGTIREEGSIGTWSFAGAIEAAKDVFIGATINYNSGTYIRDREYFEDDIDNKYDDRQTAPNDPLTTDFRTFALNDIIDWEFSGWNAKLGLLSQHLDFVTFGAAIKLPTRFSITEKYYYAAEAEYGDNYLRDMPAESSLIEYDITTPYEFTAGASVKLPLLLVSGQITVIDYSQMEFTSGLTEGKRSDNNKAIIELFRSVMNYHLGAEIKIPFTKITARAGVMYLHSPYVDDPSEFDKTYLNIGAGFASGKSFTFDVAYSFGFWETFGDNYGAGISRTYQEIESQNVLITTKFKF